MSSPLCVVIPTLNAAAQLPDCLAALAEGRKTGIISQVIIVDGGSSDDTAQIAAAAGATVINAPPSRGGQLRCGADAAKCDYILFLHADTRLQSGWSAAINLRPDMPPRCFRLRFNRGGAMARIVAGWANLRTRLFNLPYGDQGLLITAQAYRSAGGHPDQPLMEDVALSRALPRIHMLPIDAITSADKFISQGWLRRGAANWLLLLRYFTGTDPEILAQKYKRKQ